MSFTVVIWTAIISAVISTCVGALWKCHLAFRKNRVRVIRIKDPDKQLNILLEALQIYEDEKYISEEDKDASDDIIRWIKEVRDEKANGNCKLEDFFLVAKTSTHVIGMAYAHLYPSVQMAFFSYLIALPSYLASGRRASSRLLARLRRELLRTKRCKAIVTEVEEPEAITDHKGKNTARVRIRTLQNLAKEQRVVLRSVRIPYKQPRLNLDDPTTQEKPLRLMIVFQETSGERRVMTRRELKEILTFLAEFIYGGQFEDEPERDREYRAYLAEWKAELIKSAPKEIELY